MQLGDKHTSPDLNFKDSKSPDNTPMSNKISKIITPRRNLVPPGFLGFLGTTEVAVVPSGSLIISGSVDELTCLTSILGSVSGYMKSPLSSLGFLGNQKREERKAANKTQISDCRTDSCLPARLLPRGTARGNESCQSKKPLFPVFKERR